MATDIEDEDGGALDLPVQNAMEALRGALEFPVRNAMEALRVAIAERIAAEQTRDQLTGLPNGTARDRWLQEAIVSGRKFWVAFIEVDKFKSVNDEYGYESADLFLKYLAREMRGVRALLPVDAVPFRAHGDEFFYAGPLSPEENESDALLALTTVLEVLRTSIESLRVPCTKKVGQTIHATVSVGWVFSEDIDELEVREVLTTLECAVSRAKHLGRNRVVRFADDMRKADKVDGRADCGSCSASFHLTVKATDLRTTPLACPNCGGVVDRPFSVRPPPPVA